MIRIVIIDKHKLFRVSFKSLLEFNTKLDIVKDVSTLKELPLDFKTNKIDLLILDPTDLSLRDFSEIQIRFAWSKVVVLTQNLIRQDILDYMSSGIAAYYSKNDCPQQLQNALVDLAQGAMNDEVKLGTVVQDMLVSERYKLEKKRVRLSNREIEVLRLVCLEKTNAEIASVLGLSERTIETHRRRMIDKADCRTILGVVLNAFELNLEDLKNPTNKIELAI